MGGKVKVVLVAVPLPLPQTNNNTTRLLQILLAYEIHVVTIPLSGIARNDL